MRASESHWTGSGKVLLEDDKCILYSGKPEGEKKLAGVGMWLDSKSSKSLLGFEPVPDRLIRVRLAGKPRNPHPDICTHEPSRRRREDFVVAYNQLSTGICTPWRRSFCAQRLQC